MKWLNDIVDEVIADKPSGDIVVSSGVSPSGKYHLGTLREILTAEVIAREIRNRGRNCRHLHIVDDLDVFRKVPIGIPEDFKQYLGKPLCDVPSPDGSDKSYADYFLSDLELCAKSLNLDMEVVRSHKKYRAGFFVEAIEKTLENVDEISNIIEKVSQRKLDSNWSPVQILEDGYLKTRKFISLDKIQKEIVCVDKDGNNQKISYKNGEVKLSWRIDWPARWWLLGVDVEPFGRDHATKGGSYDTGKEIVQKVFGGVAPVPVPYHFINRAGATKKMSKSAGDTIDIKEILQVLPPEMVWFFIIRFAPSRQLFFDEGQALIRLFDEFSELLAKPGKSAEEKQLINLCSFGIENPTISSVPFSHLVASYQASLKNPQKTLKIIARTEHADAVIKQETIILDELKFIDNWLNKWAPADVTFELIENPPTGLNQLQKEYLTALAELIEKAPKDADGEWFHQTIYELKDKTGLTPKELFSTLYQVLIGKDAGPRAGWFVSILPRDWLLKRLRLEQ